jgi:aspartate carbamoyltransferase catalytic subunit
LTQALTQFNTTYHLVSPLELKLPSAVKIYIKDAKLEYNQYTDLREAIPHADVLYVTRIQRERFSDPIEYEKVKNSYNLTKSMLEGSKPNLRVLHPLPRVTEINEDVDDTQQAYYFQQALNGVYVRQALLKAILGL